MKQLADEHGADALVVVFGMNEPDRLRVLATTFRALETEQEGG